MPAIVIPSYNPGPWLGHAVRSALDQTHPALAVIVVDNASTDSSLAGLDRSDPRLQVISLPENRGAPAARNIGWRAAPSEATWIQFLDADDALLPTKIATQLHEAAPLEAVDVIYSPVLQESAPSPSSPPPTTANRTPSAPPDAPVRSPQHIDPSRPLAAQWLRWELGQTGALLWRRTALEQIGGWREDQPCCQDNEITLRALKAGLSFRFAPTPGAIYRHWSDTTLSRADPALTLRQRALLTLDSLAWLESADPSSLPALRPAIAEEAYAVARLLAAQGHIPEAARYLRNIRRFTPISPTGRACPAHYRILHCLLGFSRTEALARSLRPTPPHTIPHP